MSRSCLAFALLCLCAPALHAQQAPTKIAVFIRGQSAATGFTDPSKARQDSVKDLIKKIRESKTMRLAESADDALVILEILDRGTGRTWRPFMGLQNHSTVVVRVTAGEYTADFNGESGDTGAFTGYRKAATQIVKQMDEWIATNRDRILALKQTTPIETSSPKPPL